MVDAVVSYVVEKLGDFLIKEALFLHGVKSEVQWLKDELRYMQRFLKDAEERQYEDATICGWVSDIRELAFDIEDLLYTFHLKVHTVATDNGEKPKSKHFPYVDFNLFNKGKKRVNLYNIGKEVEEFKNRINDLSRRRQLYGLQDSGNSGERRRRALGKLKDMRRVTSFAVEKNVVGFEDDAEELLTKLLDDDPPRLVISIYGMGGLGKTTLAGKLYHNDSVRQRFNYRAWVSVSQDYTTQDLLRRIIKSFEFGTIKMEELEKMDEVDLGRYLLKSLEECTYLVVIDDVWDKEAWATLKRAFPDNNNGSRVIVTTRNKEVAERSDKRTHAHKLRYLRPNESWQLFCEKAFQNLKMDERLEKLGREMVEKCDGLPLAIIVLGGLLSTRKRHDWQAVHDHIWRHLKNDSIEISSLLALSFDYLPYELKPCFLYLGVFPEDAEIYIEQLIHLLVAEGFIMQDEDHTMEEMAKDYLDELANRSLLQMDQKSWGRNATCRVHDLLRDLAIETAKKMEFFYIYDEDKRSNKSSIMSSTSRQVVYSRITELSWFEQCNPHLRTLFLRDERQQLVPAMCKQFGSLRVLSVEKIEQQMLAKEMKELSHLKYLRLINQGASLSSLSVSNLQRLQTLDVYPGLGKPGVYSKLSGEIHNLQELRHLIGNFSEGPLLVDNLEKLQTLRYVHVKDWVKVKTEKLVNLRDLGLISWTRKKVFSFDCVANVKSLQILSIELEAETFGSLQPLSHCHHLVDLKLNGRMMQLQEDLHEFLPRLECLTLENTHFQDDPMPLLEKLPNLTILDFRSFACDGSKMKCGANGFLQLEILQVWHLEELQVEEGAFPRLRGLKLPRDCELMTPETMRSRIQKTLM